MADTSPFNQKFRGSLVFLALITLVLVSTVEGHGHHNHHHHQDDHHHEHSHPNSNPNPYLSTAISYLFPTESAMVNSFLATFYISLFPNLILLFVPNAISGSKLNLLVSFAVGGLLGDVFLHLLPHTYHDTFLSAKGKGEDYLLKRNLTVGVTIFLGMLSFWVLDKLLRIVSGKSGHSHSHNHSHGHSPSQGDSTTEGSSTALRTSTHQPTENLIQRKNKATDSSKKRVQVEAPQPEVKHSAYLNLIADFSHNFTDGLAIAASFYVSKPIGISTTLAVFLHEIPHEVGDFAILLQAGFSRLAAMYSQFFTALGAFLGTLVGVILQELLAVTHHEGESISFLQAWGIPVEVNDLVLPLTAGGFLYIATVSVIPELLECPDDLKDQSGEPDKFKLTFQLILELLCMLVGVSLMALVSLYE